MRVALVIGGGGDVGRQGVDLGQLVVGDAGGGPLGGLAGQGAEDGEVVEDVAGAEADHGDAAAGSHLDEALVGQLQQRLPDRRAAGAELGAQGVEVEAGARGQRPGEDAVAELLGRPGPDRAADAAPG